MNIDAISLKALTIELSETIVEGTIQKISHLNSSDLLLHIRQPGKTYKLLIQLGNGQSNIHLTSDEMPPAQIPSSLVMMLRKHLQGQRLRSIEQPTLDRTIYLRTDRHSLVLELSGRRNNAILLNDQGIIMGKLLPEPPQSRLWLIGQKFCPQSNHEQPDVLSSDISALRSGLVYALGSPALSALTRGLFGLPPWHAEAICQSVGLSPQDTLSLDKLDTVLQAIEIWRKRLICGPYDPTVLPNGKTSPWSLGMDGEESYITLSEALSAERKLPGLTELRQDLLHTISKMQKKRSHTLEKMEEQQKRAQNNESLMEYGNLILAYMHQIKPRATSIDVYDNNGELVSIKLNPDMNASDNAQHYFKEYKRLKRAQTSTLEPIEKLKRELEFIADMELSAQQAETIQELEELKQIWQQEFYPKEASKKHVKRINAPALGPRVFKHSGFTILVGRNPCQNDTISTKIASSGDVWLHTLRVPGAHVLIKSAGRQPAMETILAAAHLAAKHSHARLDHRVEVLYTDAKYVHKVKGCQPGRVIVKSMKSIVASPHEEIAGLLQITGQDSDRCEQ